MYVKAGIPSHAKRPILDLDAITRVNAARTDFSEAARVLHNLSDHLEIVANSDPTAQAMADLRREWIKLVRQSTWVSPIPATEDTIIAEVSSGGGRARLVLGWYAFKGPRWRARGRLDLRIKKFVSDNVPAVLSRYGLI